MVAFIYLTQHEPFFDVHVVVAILKYRTFYLYNRFHVILLNKLFCHEYDESFHKSGADTTRKVGITTFNFELLNPTGHR